MAKHVALTRVCTLRADDPARPRCWGRRAHRAVHGQHHQDRRAHRSCRAFMPTSAGRARSPRQSSPSRISAPPRRASRSRSSPAITRTRPMSAPASPTPGSTWTRSTSIVDSSIPASRSRSARSARVKNKVVLVSGAASSDLTGPKCNANTLHWAYDTWSSPTVPAKRWSRPAATPGSSSLPIMRSAPRLSATPPRSSKRTAARCSASVRRADQYQ